MKNWRECWKRVSGEPRTFGKSFLISLWNVDNGRIRLRWSEEHEKYAVERKVTFSMQWKDDLEACRVRKSDGRTVLRDSWIQAHDGYVPIDLIHPASPIESRLVENLQYFDLARWGGSKEFLKHIEEMEQLREIAKEKEHDDAWYNLASDSYDQQFWANGERVTVPEKVVNDGGNGVII